MARIKTWLLATRHTVRDYLDTVVLLERLGEERASETFREFDEIYRQLSGVSPLAEAVERLAAAAPGDLRTLDLQRYKGLMAPWKRVHALLTTVPLPLPHFWLAALKALGEDVEVGAETPDYFENGPY